MQTTTRINTPVLTELAQPATSLILADLTDVDHPVNNKSLSGKREGMGCLVGGVLYMATGSDPSDSWQAVTAAASVYNYSGGLFDYNDAATTVTPIAVTGGAGDFTLTNDELGSFTNKTYPPSGVSDLWDSSTNRFDFTPLKLGDMVDIRIDVDVTTASVNTEVKIDLVIAVGGFSYRIPWVLETNFKTTGTYKLNKYNGIYMGDTNTLDNPAYFAISSDKDCTVVVNGWYIKVIQRG